VRGIMQARQKPVETWTLADLGVDPGAVGAGAATTKTLDAAKPPERAGATFVREAPDDAVAKVVEFLSSRRLI
jgi:electron transfer flavoprotein beta subunit